MKLETEHYLLIGKRKIKLTEPEYEELRQHFERHIPCPYPVWPVYPQQPAVPTSPFWYTTSGAGEVDTSYQREWETTFLTAFGNDTSGGVQ